jgi:hypothetical protein
MYTPSALSNDENFSNPCFNFSWPLFVFIRGRVYTKASTLYMIIYCFTSRSRIFHLYGDVTIAGEGLQNLGLCSALRAFEQGWNTCCDTGPWFFRFHPKDRPSQSPFTTRMGMLRTYSNPDPHGACTWESLALALIGHFYTSTTFYLLITIIFIHMLTRYIPANLKLKTQ